MISAMKGHLANLQFAAPRTVSKVDDQVRVFRLKFPPSFSRSRSHAFHSFPHLSDLLLLKDVLLLATCGGVNGLQL